MESKETIVSGVTVISAEAPSNYHVAHRSVSPLTEVALAPSSAVVTPVSVGMAGSMDRKKRGRPRKYGPDGIPQRLYSPKPVSGPSPPAVVGFSSGMRGRGTSATPEAKHQQIIQTVTMGDEFDRSDGANFTPHVVTVNVGEDVTGKIMSFCQQGSRAICVLSANGTVSNATLRQSNSSGGTLTYEGRFEIVNLCGSFIPAERDGTRYRAGGLSVSLSSPNGQVVGGCVAGLLVAASPIQIIVGSFLPSIQPEVKPRKPKAERSSLPAPFTITALPPPANGDKEMKDSRNGQGHNIPIQPIKNLTSPPSLQRENWSNTQSLQE